MAPALGRVIQDVNVQSQIGLQVVAQICAAAFGKQTLGLVHFFLRHGSLGQSQLRVPVFGQGRQPIDQQSLHSRQESKRKVSLGLLQVKELPKLAQAGARRKQTHHVSKGHTALDHLDGRHLVAFFFQTGSQFFFKEVGHQVIFQQHLIVSRAVKTKDLVPVDQLAQP